MAQLKNKRVGETNYNNQGELMEIVEYYDANHVIVKFKQTNNTNKCAYREFKQGKVSDNFYPSVCGVGYIGNATIVKGKRNVKRSYRIWADMLLRCYSDKYRKDNPTYENCFVCKEWLCYENFEKWYDENYYETGGERMHIDKDILIKGNKIYSPETCVFVPIKINSLFTKRDKVRGKYPIGVTRNKKTNKFTPQVQGCDWLGYYNSPEEAFNVYKEKKEEYIRKIADEYKDTIPLKLYNALYNYQVEITD